MFLSPPLPTTPKKTSLQKTLNNHHHLALTHYHSTPSPSLQSNVLPIRQQFVDTCFHYLTQAVEACGVWTPQERLGVWTPHPHPHPSLGSVSEEGEGEDVKMRDIHEGGDKGSTEGDMSVEGVEGVPERLSPRAIGDLDQVERCLRLLQVGGGWRLAGAGGWGMGYGTEGMGSCCFTRMPVFVSEWEANNTLKHRILSSISSSLFCISCILSTFSLSSISHLQASVPYHLNTNITPTTPPMCVSLSLFPDVHYQVRGEVSPSGGFSRGFI